MAWAPRICQERVADGFEEVEAALDGGSTRCATISRVGVLEELPAAP